METVLLLLPTIFSFMSGILIAWSTYLLYKLTGDSETTDPTIKITNGWCMLLIAVIAISLIFILFVFTTFAAFHMSTIIFLEIWYATFLYHVSYAPAQQPVCNIKISPKQSSVIPLVHFHK